MSYTVYMKIDLLEQDPTHQIPCNSCTTGKIECLKKFKV